MTTKQANLSRRSVLGGSLAALTASPALATAAAPGNDDSALLAMGQEWRKAWSRYSELAGTVEEAEARYRAMLPENLTEIVTQSQDAARAAYLADMEAARQQSGLAEASEAEREAVKTLHELEERIARTQAKTPKGMLVKARIAVADPVTVSTVDDLESALEERLDTGHIIGLSLILDVLHMYGGDA